MSASLQHVNEFQKRTLVVLCGTSPAVLTETLEVISDPTHRLYFPPTRIIVITTRVGREKLQEELLNPTVNSKLGRGRIGRLQRMAEDIGLAPFPLAETDILVQRDAKDATQTVQAKDAVVLDTTYLTQPQQVERIVALARAVSHRPHVT